MGLITISPCCAIFKTAFNLSKSDELRKQIGERLLSGNLIDPIRYCSGAHSVFEIFEHHGIPALAYFIEPVVRTLNYAKQLGYKAIDMVGFSGGAWATVVTAAIDPRIRCSIHIQGSRFTNLSYVSHPWDSRRPGQLGFEGDYEAEPQRALYLVCPPWCLIALASLGRGRANVMHLYPSEIQASMRDNFSECEQWQDGVRHAVGASGGTFKFSNSSLLQYGGQIYHALSNRDIDLVRDQLQECRSLQ